MMTQQCDMEVLIVPGLFKPGAEQTQRFIYDQVANLWERDGHSAVVHRFGWYEGASLDEQQGRLAETIDAMQGDRIYAIGASAGGLAVVNALADRPDKLQGVATITSPLNMTEEQLREFGKISFVPPMFGEAYRKCDATLNRMGKSATDKMVSFYARRDTLVPPMWSRREPITSHELRMWGHKVTIFAALTAYRKQVQGELLNLGRDK